MSEIELTEDISIPTLIKDAKFIPSPNSNTESNPLSIWTYLWDEYEDKNVQEKIKKHEKNGANIYTLVNEDGKDWLCHGFMRVNRMGYLIAKCDIKLRDYTTENYMEFTEREARLIDIGTVIGHAESRGLLNELSKQELLNKVSETYHILDKTFGFDYDSIWEEIIGPHYFKENEKRSD